VTALDASWLPLGDEVHCSHGLRTSVWDAVRASIENVSPSIAVGRTHVPRLKPTHYSFPPLGVDLVKPCCQTGTIAPLRPSPL
jgi:hypothetical protein